MKQAMIAVGAVVCAAAAIWLAASFVQWDWQNIARWDADERMGLLIGSLGLAPVTGMALAALAGELK